jgi:hypothetical protein
MSDPDFFELLKLLKLLKTGKRAAAPSIPVFALTSAHTMARQVVPPLPVSMMTLPPGWVSIPAPSGCVGCSGMWTWFPQVVRQEEEGQCGASPPAPLSAAIQGLLQLKLRWVNGVKRSDGDPESVVQGRKPPSANGRKRKPSLTDHVVEFLNFIRDKFDPRGVKFLDLVRALETTNRITDVYADLPLSARPSTKYVLRKLAADVLATRKKRGRGRREKEDFLTNDLQLSLKSTFESLWTKADAIEILVAVCRHFPDLARIPSELRSRAYKTRI